MVASLSRPFKPIRFQPDTLAFFQLGALHEGLQREDEYQENGVAGVTLGRDEEVTLVLVALRKGAVMREHRAPSAGMAMLLTGRARFVSGNDGSGTELGPHTLAAFAAGLPHALEAHEDCALLLIIGGRDRTQAAHGGH